MMFDRLSLVSLWNQRILQLHFLTYYLAEHIDLESFGFALCRLFEYKEVHAVALSFSYAWQKALSDN